MCVAAGAVCVYVCSSVYVRVCVCVSFVSDEPRLTTPTTIRIFYLNNKYGMIYFGLVA